MPNVEVVVGSAAYGLVIGSFLNVAVHRVPAGRSVVSPGSACPACGTHITVRDNLPVLSWVLLRGRCRGCGHQISIRYPLVEALTAVAFAAVAARFGWSFELGAFCALAAGLVAVSAVDLDCRRIPTPMLRATVATGLPFLVAATVVRSDPWPLARAGVAAVGCFAALFVVHLASPAGMGFGDVRLAGVLGAFLGWLGPGHAPLGLFCGFLAGSVAGVALVMVGRAGRRSALAFGPFLSGGAMVAVLWGDQLLESYRRLGA